MKSILWVDDDPLVLSSAKRLLQINGFEVHTLEDPTDVQGWLNSHDVSVIVSDQRMPQMSGIELLKQTKTSYPLVTRIMITGFLDPEVVQMAINDADVFRFITKPWSEAELIADILQGIEHHEKMVAREKLSAQIREQNKKLEAFTANLENLIVERTFELSRAKQDLEYKNSRIKNIVSFLQNISEMEDVQDVLDSFFLDIKKEFPILNCFFAFTDYDQKSKILFRLKNKWHEHKVHKMWTYKKEIRIFDLEDKTYIANETRIPITYLVAIPLIKYNDSILSSHTLFIEIDKNKELSDVIVDYVVSRLQILSLGVDKIISQNKSKLELKSWEKTFDSISDPLCILNSDHSILRKNSAFENRLDLKDLNSVDIKAKTYKHLNKFYNLYFYEIKDSDQNKSSNYLCYFHDVTDEKLLYQKLLQGEKVAAIGLLAGNIAHELNNPLTGIRSMAQILVQDKSLPPEQLSDLVEIEKACLRCQNIIQSLIDFSDLKESSAQKTSVQDIIQKTLPLLKTALRHHNTEIDMPKKDILIFGDFKLIQQVLFNLVNNACQAMPNKGTVTIKVQSRSKNASIQVSDTGPGLPETILPHLFEPFVTTKKEGEGTGLGLSFSKSVVERMNGSLKLLRNSNQGATFEILIPEVKP